MIRLRLETELTVSEPNEDDGLVVRWRVAVVKDHDDDEREEVIGGVRASLIHYGEAVDVGAKLDDVMDGALLPLYRALFTEDGWLRDDLDDANGSGLLYIDEIDLADKWRDRLVDLAVIRRLAETLGQGCSLLVLNGNEARRAQEWARLGFAVVREPAELFLVLNLGKRTPRVRAGFDRFEVVPAPRPESPNERANERVREHRN